MTAMSEFNVVVLRAGSNEPELRSIDGSLGSMQEIVGGMIEAVTLDYESGICLYCNEEGKLKEMVANLALPELNDIVVGNVFIAAHDKEGALRRMSDAEVYSYTYWLGKHALRHRVGLDVPPSPSPGDNEKFARILRSRKK